MSNDHYEDLTNTAAYLSEHAKSNFEKMPEKTIAKVLNQAPPSVREAIAVQYKGLELLNDSGGRLAPFQEKRYDHYDSLPATMKTSIDKLRTEELSTALLDRMGHEQPEQPVSRRDYLEAAFDQHGEHKWNRLNNDSEFGFIPDVESEDYSLEKAKLAAGASLQNRFSLPKHPRASRRATCSSPPVPTLAGRSAARWACIRTTWSTTWKRASASANVQTRTSC